MRAAFRWTPVLLFGALSSACSSDNTVLGEPPPTEIAVDPLEFLGELPCSEDDGAAKAYVAAPTDQTEGFVLAASPPAPCSSRVAFRYIVIGHAYTAEVDVYDRPASELTPAGGRDSGSRVMLDADGVVVPPRWHTRCGVGDSGPAVAIDDASVVVAGCDPLESQGGEGTTAIVVDPTSALGSLDCGDGAVDAIRVVPVDGPDGAALPTVTLGCGAPPVTFNEGIVPGALYTFRLEALAPGENTPTWASTCTAVAARGVSRRAACETLTGDGAILVDTAGLEEPGFACGLDYSAYDLTLEGPASVSLPRTGCTSGARLAPVPPGHYEGTLRTFEDGQVERTARCTVDVAPAESASLDCSF